MYVGETKSSPKKILKKDVVATHQNVYMCLFVWTRTCVVSWAFFQ